LGDAGYWLVGFICATPSPEELIIVFYSHHSRNELRCNTSYKNIQEINMIKKFKSTSSLSAAAVGLAMIGATAMPMAAFASDEPVQQQTTNTISRTTSSDDMTVVRDAVTGQLRMPTAKEHSDMQEQNQLQQLSGRNIRSRVAPGRALQKNHRSGAVGARLTDEHISSVVMVRKADGNLEKQCFDSHEAAESTVKANAIVGASTSTKLETE
jgi:hypothetical protein